MEKRVSISISEGRPSRMSGWCGADKMNALDAAMFDAIVAASDRLAHERLAAVVLSARAARFAQVWTWAVSPP